MGKVSIGLRGWRFDEEDVFSDDEKLLPLEEMPADASERISRLTALVNSPCDACWLIHGDENLDACNVASVVYGEPLSEVLLCDEHESDFIYWYRERGGAEYRGDPALQDAFHEWFADGSRAPTDYAGIEHVSTAPEELPNVEGADPSVLDVELPEERRERIDLREQEVYEGEEVGRDEGTQDQTDDEEAQDTDEETTDDDLDFEDADVDLSQDYPT